MMKDCQWLGQSRIEKTKTLIEFLSTVRSHVGDIACQFFTSDCAEQYYNAQVNVFGTNDTKMSMAYRRKALQRHIDSKQERIDVYHQLLVIMEEKDKANFAVKFQQLMSFLMVIQVATYEYLKNEYAPKVEQWAVCFRLGTPVNTKVC